MGKEKNPNTPDKGDNQQPLHVALDSLKIAGVNFAYRFINDEFVREQYIAQIKGASEEVLSSFKCGELTSEAAALKAHSIRKRLWRKREK